MEPIELPDIPENGCRGLSVEVKGEKIDIILVRKNNELYCYRNRCPHMGINLDWMPDQFLDVSETLLQCATHGALFNIDDGYCIAGPCAGQSLQRVKFHMENDKFRIISQ